MAWVAENLWDAGVRIMGSRTYQEMASYWPYADGPCGRTMNEIPKVVFSRSGPVAPHPAKTDAGGAGPRPVRGLDRRAASLGDAEEPVRASHRVFPESVGFAGSVPRRRAVRDRQWRGRAASAPSAVGRSNWLHVGGDGGLKTAAVLLSLCGSARHGTASTRGRTCTTCSMNSPPVLPMPT